mgnify:CR=1 FL=1
MDVVSHIPDAPEAILPAQTGVTVLSTSPACEESTHGESVQYDIVSGQPGVIELSALPAYRESVQSGQTSCKTALYKQNGKSSSYEEKLMHIISTDAIHVPAIKRCARCTGCLECKKQHLPDQIRQKEQVEVIKKSLQFIGDRYVASYVYNSNLSQLQENKVPCTRMMNSLEVKLKKHGLVEQFNCQVKDFFNTDSLSNISSSSFLKFFTYQ